MTVETFPTNPLGLKGTPLQIEAFFAGLLERWRDILGPFREVRIGRLGAVSRGHEGAIRSLEPQMADVDRVFEELAARASAELDVGALARGCRDASPLIPEVLEMAAGVGRFLLKAVLEGLEADYDG